jgi:Homeodomain-like domain
MTTWHHDHPALFFAICAALTLCVSIPATYALLAPFHDGGGYGGIALAVFATAVFEIGAVGAKLITVSIPAWRGRLTLLTLALLLLTSAGNYIHGAELFRAATLPPMLATIRASDYAWLLVAGASALFPALLFVWLLAFTARVEKVTHNVNPLQPLVDSLQAQLTQALTELDATRRALSTQVDAPPALADTPVKQLTDKRAQARALLDAGARKVDIAARLGVSRQTIDKWVKEG